MNTDKKSPLCPSERDNGICDIAKSQTSDKGIISSSISLSQTIPPLHLRFLTHLRYRLPSCVWTFAHIATGITKTSLAELNAAESRRLIEHFHTPFVEVELSLFSNDRGGVVE